ncbi:dienelactone hydrolase family protein [Mycolicibacterium komossense]|uniref:Dienelactone hydrolase family protein n=1 Tax=Mycolicibacterium komossense TaxID=1779 RepID=A0ABT3CIH6_9MYCO|nr:dienelactone hydrolase family protein [Mycolicibacterium komossense]MCV7229349.1 dienelactone hydrolase family protein [Mycolicibacterium komossense]
MPDVTFDAAPGTLPGYQTEPTGPGPWPGVVVIHDAFGLTGDLKRICDRLANAGYLTLAPALFRRGNRVACVVATLRAMATGSGAAIDDIVAARDHLAADPRCTGKIGIVGFCMGGGFALQMAPRGVFDAAAPNYGNLPKNLDALRDACPTVASYGAKDRTLPGAAAKLEKVFTEGNVAHDVKEYPEVGHSFMNDFGTPAPLQFVVGAAGFLYSEPEAEDAWQRIEAFFGEHLN